MFSSLLVILPSLIGIGALTAGTYSLLNPQSASRLYGLSPAAPTSSLKRTATFSDLLSFLDTPSAPSSPAERSTAKPDTHRPSQGHDDQSHLSSHIPLAFRNISTGLAILLLTAYWQTVLSDQELPQVVSSTVQYVLGFVILAGSFVPFIDAWICWRASFRIGSGGRAACLHVGRGMVWVGTGLWLLQHDRKL